MDRTAYKVNFSYPLKAQVTMMLLEAPLKKSLKLMNFLTLIMLFGRLNKPISLLTFSHIIIFASSTTTFHFTSISTLYFNSERLEAETTAKII